MESFFPALESIKWPKILIEVQYFQVDSYNGFYLRRIPELMVEFYACSRKWRCHPGSSNLYLLLIELAVDPERPTIL